MQELVNMTGLELSQGSYVSAARACACHVGIMAAAEFGIKNSEDNVFASGSSVLGIGGNLEPHMVVASAYGVSLDYIVGLEVGFERWPVEHVNPAVDTESEDFNAGLEDGRDTRSAVREGRITPAPVKQEEITVEGAEDITFGRDGLRTDDSRLAVHAGAISDGSAWRV